MKQQEFLHHIITRNARVVTGPSATRGKDNEGVGKAARAHLPKIGLHRFATHNQRRFLTALDEETESLLRSFPTGARDNWGLARKLLNLFLRDCLYTIYLEKAFRLSRAEHLFELPLDSITARELKKTAGRGGLPRWSGIIHLTPELSSLYQAHALAESKKQGYARLHLDALWWAGSRKEAQQ
jgi:hypothetical protein